MPDLDTINNRTASHLIRRALAILSRQYGTTIMLKMFSHGEVCIVFKDKPMFINIPCKNYSVLYCTSAKEYLNLLIHYNAILEFSDSKLVQFSTIFGTSLDELKIKLDLFESG